MNEYDLRIDSMQEHLGSERHHKLSEWQGIKYSSSRLLNKKVDSENKRKYLLVGLR